MLSATVGSRRDARIAGYRPASAPIVRVAVRAAAKDQGGITVVQAWARAKAKVAAVPRSAPAAPPSADRSSDSIRNCERRGGGRDRGDQGAALKLLHAGPTAAEQVTGLTTLVHDDLPISASGDGKKVTVALGAAKVGPEQTGLLGQLGNRSC